MSRDKLNRVTGLGDDELNIMSNDIELVTARLIHIELVIADGTL